LPRPAQQFLEGLFTGLTPISPYSINAPQEGEERPAPRYWQYPVGWNLPVGVPGSEGLKLTTFANLRGYADLYSVVRACIEVRKQEVLGLEWDIVLTPEADQRVRYKAPGEQSSSQQFRAARKKIRRGAQLASLAKPERGLLNSLEDFRAARDEVIKFFKRPDPNYDNFRSWLSTLLEEIFVVDALSIYIQPTRKPGKGIFGSDTAALDILDGTCYSADTEVLTRAGWKRFDRVQIGPEGDEFATRNPRTHVLEWQAASYLHEAEWNQPMVHFTSRGLDLLVTPNHRILTDSCLRGRKAESHGDGWAISADELMRCGNGSQKLPLTSRTVRDDIPFIELPETERHYDEYVVANGSRLREARLARGLSMKALASQLECSYATVWKTETQSSRVRRGLGERWYALLDIPFMEAGRRTDSPVRVSGDDWAAFMGAWLAEGSVSRNPRPTIYITQSRSSKGYEAFKRLLTRILGREPAYNGQSFYFRHAGLAIYLDKLGHSSQKFIPTLVKEEFSSRKLEIFWNFYWLGDGDASRQRISTSSRQMANDLQIIAQQMGRWASISVYEPKSIGRLPGGRFIKAEHAFPKYVVARHDYTLATWKAQEEAYTQKKVYCVSVPNESLYVRRNGLPVWCLNTIRPLVNTFGGRPTGGAVAYQQYLWGVPRVDLMTVITERDLEEFQDDLGEPVKEYRGDQLLYLPHNRRSWTPYGFPCVERCLLPLSIGLRRQQYILDYFQEGTVPSVYISPGPDVVSPEQIRQLQEVLNAVAGDQAWKHKVIVLPGGSHTEQMKPFAMDTQTDTNVMEQVLMAFEVQPQELGLLPGGRSSGMGGRGMGQVMQETSERKALKPMLQWLKEAVFDYLLQEVWGMTDLEWQWSYDEEEDDQQRTDYLKTMISIGAMSVDEVRSQEGLEPWGLQMTADPFVLGAQGPIPLGVDPEVFVPPSAEDKVRMQVEAQEELMRYQNQFQQQGPNAPTQGLQNRPVSRPPEHPPNPKQPTGAATPPPPGQPVKPSVTQRQPRNQQMGAHQEVREREALVATESPASKLTQAEVAKEFKSLQNYLRHGRDPLRFSSQIITPEMAMKVTESAQAVGLGKSIQFARLNVIEGQVKQQRESRLQPIENQARSELHRLASQLQEGKIATITFVDQATAAMERGYREAYRAGRVEGGSFVGRHSHAVIPPDISERSIPEQHAYIQGFLQDLMAGISSSELGQRVNLYSNTTRQFYERGYKHSVDAAGIPYDIMWHSNPNACDKCQSRDNQAFSSENLPGLPGTGNFGGDFCRGGPNCGCWLEYRISEK
jgi:transcriptional regulator with XRE-family HTH domain